MPNRVKIPLSVVVLLVAAAACWFQLRSGQTGPAWTALLLGPFSVLAMWIFPEVKRTPR